MNKQEYATAMQKLADLLNVPEGNIDACVTACGLRLLPNVVTHQRWIKPTPKRFCDYYAKATLVSFYSDPEAIP